MPKLEPQSQLKLYYDNSELQKDFYSVDGGNGRSQRLLDLSKAHTGFDLFSEDTTRGVAELGVVVLGADIWGLWDSREREEKNGASRKDWSDAQKTS